MSLRKVLLPAALVAVIAFIAPRVNAQTMGEYAGTTAGVGTASGSMGTSFSLPAPSINSGASSGTWGVSGTGGTFEERAGAASGSGLGGNFEARAGSGACFCGESRWPGTGISNAQANRFGSSSDRFSTGDRFAAGDRFSTGDRWKGTAFSDHMGLDTNYNR